MIRNVILVLLIALAWTGSALAIPETLSVRVTDVTASSFSMVWMTDVASTPAVEVYSDSAMINRLTDTVTAIPMPDIPQDVATSARSKGIMKARVAGLAPNTTYYARTVTVDPANPGSIAYSGIQQVTTAKSIVPYRPAADGTLQGAANDLMAVQVYIRPNDSDAVPGQGDLILLETPLSPYPVSAFVGVGITAPRGVLDLNNLFGTDMSSLFIQGGEKALVSIYRGGPLATLIHYRKFSANSGTVAVGEPVMGFFADINLDGKVDEADFAEFRKQYKTQPNDGTYNPDYDFFPLETARTLFPDPVSRIDAQDFAAFAKEYGKAVGP